MRQIGNHSSGWRVTNISGLNSSGRNFALVKLFTSRTSAIDRDYLN
jgi:hypothetical protein